MTALSRRFLLGLGVLLSVTLGILFYASQQQPIAYRVVHLTALPGLALSNPWYAPHSPLTSDSSDTVYWDMPLPKRMEFIYAP